MPIDRRARARLPGCQRRADILAHPVLNGIDFVEYERRPLADPQARARRHLPQAAARPAAFRSRRRVRPHPADEPRARHHSRRHAHRQHPRARRRSW